MTRRRRRRRRRWRHCCSTHSGSSSPLTRSCPRAAATPPPASGPSSPRSAAGPRSPRARVRSSCSSSRQAAAAADATAARAVGDRRADAERWEAILADGDKQDGDTLLFSPAMAADLAKLRAAEPEEEEEEEEGPAARRRRQPRRQSRRRRRRRRSSNGDALLSLDDGDAFAKFGAALRAQAAAATAAAAGQYAGVPASIVLLHLLRSCELLAWKRGGACCAARARPCAGTPQRGLCSCCFLRRLLHPPPPPTVTRRSRRRARRRWKSRPPSVRAPLPPSLSDAILLGALRCVALCCADARLQLELFKMGAPLPCFAFACCGRRRRRRRASPRTRSLSSRTASITPPAARSSCGC